MYRYFVGPRPGLAGDRVLVRFDSDPYTDDNAVGATYIAFGDTRWVPHCGGFLAGLVRDTDGFRGISPEEVRPVILRLTVDAVEALRQVSGPR